MLLVAPDDQPEPAKDNLDKVKSELSLVWPGAGQVRVSCALWQLIVRIVFAGVHVVFGL
jgi:hypothetical protein